MLPSEFPEVQRYPNLKRLLEAQVDMQFIDLRTLLRLPQEQMGLKGGCNLTAAAILFNIIAGSSVCFYNPSEQALADRTGRSKRFKEVLEKFYPWQGEPIPKDQCVSVLYDRTRCSLVHSLGLDVPPRGSMGQTVVLEKGPLTEEQVHELEESSSRPVWVPSTIVHKRPLAHGAIELAISVPTLYWGVHRMLHALFADSTHAAKSDDLAKAFSHQWDKYVSDSGHGIEGVDVKRRCDICGTELVSTDGGQTFKCPQCSG